jgi:uncharacterized protein (UPF0303 family)
MSAELIAATTVQEKQLGLDTRDRVAALGKAEVIEVRFWARRLLRFAMPGTAANNEDGGAAESERGRRFHKSSYRLAREVAALAAALGVDAEKLAVPA